MESEYLRNNHIISSDKTYLFSRLLLSIRYNTANEPYPTPTPWHWAYAVWNTNTCTSKISSQVQKELAPSLTPERSPLYFLPSPFLSFPFPNATLTEKNLEGISTLLVAERLNKVYTIANKTQQIPKFCPFERKSLFPKEREILSYIH